MTLGYYFQTSLEGMNFIDTSNYTAMNSSTTNVTGLRPRFRDKMQYLPGVGSDTVLVAVGSVQIPLPNSDDDPLGELVTQLAASRDRVV